MLVTQYEGFGDRGHGTHQRWTSSGLKPCRSKRCRREHQAHETGLTLDIDHRRPATYKPSARATVGMFQFESRACRNTCANWKPSTFEDLIAMNALRPGPMDYIPDFIDRKHGRKPIVYDIDLMEVPGKIPTASRSTRSRSCCCRVYWDSRARRVGHVAKGMGKKLKGQAGPP